MSAADPGSDYDPFACIYNRHFAGAFVQRVFPIVERQVLRHLPVGARVLDVCCGTGQLAQLLTARGYRVTGIDASEQMLRFARQNAPEAEFVLADARTFKLPQRYDAAFSTFDSLNHMMSVADLTAVFRCVGAALSEGGWFCFDLNMPEGFASRWRGASGAAEDDHAYIFRARYDEAEQMATMDVTIFTLDGQWKRTDLRLCQRAYAPSQVSAALTEAGFRDVDALDARDLGLTDVGRSFFVARMR